MAKGFIESRPETVEWYTPPYIFEALGLRFDMDVCSPGRDIVPWVPADVVLTKAEDGLVMPWHGTVWMNPPYGGETPKWIRKLSEHGDGIALVFSRTDTNWFHDFAAIADAICFIKGRVYFVSGKTGVPAGRSACGSMLLAFGGKATAALEASGLGLILKGAPMN